MRKTVLSFLVMLFSFAADGFATELRRSGYSLIPAPQKVSLDGGEVVVDRTWGVAATVGAEHIAVRTLIQKAAELHGLKLEAGKTGQKAIVLKVSPGTVRETKKAALAEQAYKLEISADRVRITGNSGQGLFYGVQSFLQLLRANDKGEWSLPSGTIVDWPALELRFIH